MTQLDAWDWVVNNTHHRLGRTHIRGSCRAKRQSSLRLECCGSRRSSRLAIRRIYRKLSLCMLNSSINVSVELGLLCGGSSKRLSDLFSIDNTHSPMETVPEVLKRVLRFGPQTGRVVCQSRNREGRVKLSFYNSLQSVQWLICYWN